MVINCKECLTRFKVNEALLKPEGTKVKCSLCGTLFTAYPSGTKQEDEDKFVLESKDSTEKVESSEADIKFESLKTTGIKKSGSNQESRLQKFVFLASIAIIIIGSLYSAIIIFSGEKIDHIEKKISDEKGILNIQLYDINGRFIENRIVGTVFVITGNAKNGYQVPRTNIMLKGSLYTKDKTLIKEKIVPCGNVISDSELMTFDRQDLQNMLEKNISGQNMSNVDIGAGQSVPFMMVFFDLPDTIYNNGEYIVEPISSLESNLEK